VAARPLDEPTYGSAMPPHPQLLYGRSAATATTAEKRQRALRKIWTTTVDGSDGS